MDQNVFVLNIKWKSGDMEYFFKNYLKTKTIDLLAIILIIGFILISFYEFIVQNDQQKSLRTLIMVFFALVVYILLKISLNKKIKTTHTIKFENFKVSINDADLYPFEDLIVSQQYLFFKFNGKVSVGVISKEQTIELEAYLKKQNIEYRYLDHPFSFKQYAKNKI